MPKHIYLLISTFLLTLTSFTAHNDDVVNYYGIAETLSFDNTDFNLSWSAHPNDSYYKQEYVPKGESVDHFNSMLLIDFIVTDATAKLAVGAQIKTLQERKKSDAICNYQVLKSPNGDDYILDFVMSDGPGGKPDVIEWNAYHYKPYTDKTGHKGVLLFALSRRAYSEKCTPFLQELRKYKTDQLEKLLKYPIPEISVK